MHLAFADGVVVAGTVVDFLCTVLSDTEINFSGTAVVVIPDLDVLRPIYIC